MSRRWTIHRLGLTRPAATLLVILCAVGAPGSARSQMPDHAALVSEAGQRFGLSETLLWAVMRAESQGDPTAVSHAGAMGLMQIMPATWAALTARHDLGSQPFEPRANILAGAAYLREMLDRYGDIALALAAYNAGPGRVDAHRTSGRPLPPETRTYVARVTRTRGMPADLPAPAMAPGWREGPLFTARSPNTSPPVEQRKASATPPATDRLFVARSNDPLP